MQRDKQLWLTMRFNPKGHLKAWLFPLDVYRDCRVLAVSPRVSLAA